MKPFKAKTPKNRVTITEVRQASPIHGSPRMYALQPESYAGPWDLPEGTVLEVISTPKKGSS